jgi:hypothetical protein
MHEDVVLTEEEMYTRSQKNVEQWIAAHMIPVRQSPSIHRNLADIQRLSCMHVHQTYPIDFNSQSYPTLLDGTSVRFDVVKGDPNASGVVQRASKQDMRIVGSKEVRIPFRCCTTS